VRAVYYVEFIRKKPGVSWEKFDSVIKVAYRHWAEIHPEDSPVLAIGRTWRLGPPSASYMIVWRVPDFAQIDEWTRARRTDPESARAIDEGTLSVAEIDAGVYADIDDVML
jgi:hypothetical protein